MRTRCLFIPFGLGLVTALVVLGLLSAGESWVTAAPAAGTRYVATKGDDTSNDCSSHAAPCRTIQHAVDVADPADTIKVAAGSYTDIHYRNSLTQTVYISKTVTLQGGYTADFIEPPDPHAKPTTLDAQGRGRVLYITGDVHPSVKGLRITGGDSAGLGGSWARDAGGGIYCTAAAVTISNCDILANTGRNYGGGVYIQDSAAVLRNNEVEANSAWAGGGVFLWSSPSVLRGNSFLRNRAGGRGGGAYLAWSSDALIDANLFTYNEAKFGGAGLSVDYESAATLVDNMVLNNTTGSGTGGGIFIWGDATLINTIVAGNRASGPGGGISIWWSSPRLLHTTLASNGGSSGVSVHAGSGTTSPAFTNTILVGHMLGITVSTGSTVTLQSTLWGTGEWANDTDWDGAGVVATDENHWGDPAFVGPGTGDYHIGPGSAAIGAGVDAGVHTDIDGDTRPQGDGFDLGADEFVPPPTLAINYACGRPGSFFTVTGSRFPPNATARVIVNGVSLTGSLEIDGSGDFSFLLDTSQADTGRYWVTVTANPRAMATFTLDASAPLRPEEGTGPVLPVPSGIAFTSTVYLPLVQR